MRKSVHSRAYRRLLEVLVEARRAAGLTQAAVAAKLHSPQSFVSKYESGERRIDVVEMILIGRALKADPAEILRTVTKEV